MSDSDSPQLGFIHRFIDPTNSDDLKGTRDGQKAREKYLPLLFFYSMVLGETKRI